MTDFNVTTSSGGGWTFITSQQPTSDVTTVTFTGLSGYRHIKIVAVYNSSANDSSPTLAVSGRVSGGTYRDTAARLVGNATANLKVIFATIEITNFNSTDVYKMVELQLDTIAATTLDNTSAIHDGGGSATLAPSGFSAVFYQEVWDDVKLTASIGIEGSTAGQRGYFYVFGMV